jgi:hypothetical protein
MKDMVFYKLPLGLGLSKLASVTFGSIKMLMKMSLHFFLAIDGVGWQCGKPVKDSLGH